MSKWKHPYADNTVKNYHSSQQTQPQSSQIGDKTPEELRQEAEVLRVKADAFDAIAKSQDRLSATPEAAKPLKDSTAESKKETSEEVRKQIGVLDTKLEALKDKPAKFDEEIKDLLAAVERKKSQKAETLLEIDTIEKTRAGLLAKAERLEILEQKKKEYLELMARAEELKSFLDKEGY